MAYIVPEHGSSSYDAEQRARYQAVIDGTATVLMYGRQIDAGRIALAYDTVHPIDGVPSPEEIEAGVEETRKALFGMGETESAVSLGYLGQMTVGQAVQQLHRLSAKN